LRRKIFFPIAAAVLGVIAAAQEPPSAPGSAGAGGAFFTPALEAGETRWYLSNSAGMTLERAHSRTAALRNKYSLSLRSPPASELPPLLGAYYKPFYRIELRALYEQGLESRRQWIFKDEQGLTRLNASGAAAFFAPKAPAGHEPDNGDQDGGEKGGSSQNKSPAAGEDKTPKSAAGFIEIYDEQGLVTEERRFLSDGAEYLTVYTYNNAVLIRAETGVKKAVPREAGAEEEKFTPFTTDSYRYNRSKALRSVERLYHQDANEETQANLFRIPPLTLKSIPQEDFVNPGITYGSEFLQDIIAGPGFRILYTTDDRGRIILEERQDETGELIGLIQNTWSGDRLASVKWQAGEEERLTEYGYNDEGDRIAERNYYNGVLERLVHREGDREVEDLYMNGVWILRAVWEGGRKISEERIRPKPSSQGAANGRF
jgi:hypothetical protein